MQKESIIKLVKAITIIAGLAGYSISPEDSLIIAEGIGIVFSFAYALEAWWKQRKV